MKKLFFALAFAMGITSIVSAQTKTKMAPVKDATTKISTRTVKATTTATNTGVKLKADGTPDKRYKKNQAKATGPKKADGTPDMRYKKNKK